MLNLTRRGVVILLLIGVLFQDMDRVEGLKCYACDQDKCTDADLKGNEKDCLKLNGDDAQTNCVKTVFAVGKRIFRNCISDKFLEDGGAKKNECVDLPQGKVCACDTDLCNGPASLSSPFTATMVLILSLSAIATITGHISLD